jgi:N-acetyl-alpha-D-glucosaminyl L-malate synthase BshA
MKIGITCYPTFGGSGIVATELGLELAMRGHDVHFITYANPIRLDTDIDRIHYHEVEVSSYPLFQYPPYTLALASRMAEVAGTYDLDLLHVHYAIPHSASAELARQILAPTRRLPVVTTLHGTDITLVGVDRSYFPITKFSIEQADGVTTVSEYLKRRTIEVFGVKNEITVLHNFVNCEIYKPVEQKCQTRRTLLHISNFRAVKRPLDCIRVLERVRDSVDAELWMVGDGPERASAEMLTRELGLEDHVTFHGKQTHVERLIPNADVLLLPSELESFGLVALEAMACGVPPVSTCVGGLPEVVEHGVDGYLEGVGDIEAQAGRAAALLSDDGLRRRIAAAARKTASDRFCSTMIIPKYEKYYERICS